MNRFQVGFLGRFRRVLHSQISQIKIHSLVKQDITGSRGIITEVSKDVGFVDRFNIFVIAHDPSPSRANESDIVSVMRATVR